MAPGNAPSGKKVSSHDALHMLADRRELNPVYYLRAKRRPRIAAGGRLRGEGWSREKTCVSHYPSISRGR
jgi:hypothetical protein